MQKDPPMTQMRADGGTPKILPIWVIIFMTGWLSDWSMPHTHMHIPEVQWVISPLSPICARLTGYSTESNRNPHGYSPTLPPLNQAGGVFWVKTNAIYNSSGATLLQPHRLSYVVGSGGKGQKKKSISEIHAAMFSFCCALLLLVCCVASVACFF